MLKAVLFDMDGIIFDSEQIYTRAWSYAGLKYGFDIREEHRVNTRGASQEKCKEIFQEIFGKGFDYYKIRESRIEYFDNYLKENSFPLKKGVLNILEYLKNQDLKTAIVTSTNYKNTVKYLNNANIKHYFDKIICGDMVKKGKPFPDIYIKAIDELMLTSAQCVVIEDSFNGIRAGYDAGCRVIMVPDILKPTNEINNLLFSIKNDLDEVIELLKIT